VCTAPVEKLRVILLAIVLAAASPIAPVHLPVSTQNPQAQTAFDRGLFLYYAYNGAAASRAFAQASNLDPTLAMAYWGVALAAGPDLNTPPTEERVATGARAIRRAVTLSSGLSPLERGLIAAMALRYRGSFANWNADNEAYRRAMSALVTSTPDENVALLAAEALLEHGGLSWQDGRLVSADSRDAMQLVARVLHADPANAMANHLCIHLYDLASDRAPALPCAQRLDAANFSPEAEHFAHMPAHYWIETGEYDAALRSSERAFALMNQLPADGPDAEHTQQYDKHDITVGYSAAMMLGDYATAARWSQRMTAAFGADFDSLTALRFGRYDVAVAAGTDAFAAISVRGLAALALGRISDAQSLAARMPARSAASGYVSELFLARLAESEGKYADANEFIGKALVNQREYFGGEQIPLIPAGEALGLLRMRHGDPNGAVAAFTETLALYPNDPRALFGLAEALEGTGRAADAAATMARFKKEWEGADTSVQDALP